MSGVKIYGTALNDVRLRKGFDVPVGPGFYINTVRTFSNFYPSIGDWSSGNKLQATVNMGQEPFQGDPLGFEPYDPNYIDSNWFGTGIVNSGVVTPANLYCMLYDKRYTSGKYYYEVNVLATSLAFMGFLDGSNTSTNTIRSYGVGAAAKPIDEMFTWLDPIRSTIDYTWSTAQGVGTTGGDTYQVWCDFDNQLLCVKKLGTTMSDYQNYIEG